MTKRWSALIMSMGLLAVAGVAVAAEGPTESVPPGPPAEVLERVAEATSEARAAVQDLEADLEDDDDMAGRGTEAFAARHRELAAKHAGKPGNAARVHEALANGESPAGLGQEHAAAVHELNAARKALRAAGEHPGRGVGRAGK